MAFVEIALDDKLFKAELRAYEKQFQDFTPLLSELGSQTYVLWRNIFKAEGPGWAPLSDKTLARRRKKGRGAKILRDEGRLFNSLISQFGEGAVYKLEKRTLTAGTNLPYAAVHQYGSKEKNIPRRPILPSEKQLSPMIQRTLLRFLREAEK